MLFVCLFLPSYEGCNGQPVHVYEVLAHDGLSSDDIYFRFILAWDWSYPSERCCSSGLTNQGGLGSCGGVSQF